MSEDSPIRPVEPYGASKFMVENLLEFLGQQGLEYNALRYFNVYGERQAVHAYYTTVIIAFIKNILNGKPPVIDGEGSQTMDFTYVKDVVRANILAAECEAKKEAINVGTGISTSVAELAKILIDAVGAKLQPMFSGRKSFVTHRQADTRKAEKLLGFKTQTLPRDGLTQVALEIAKHPELY